MDDEWSALSIDPNTGVKVIDIGGNSSSLPVQPAPQPQFADVDAASPTTEADVETGPLAKLFGLSGNERYQTWPERLIRSAVSAPMDAAKGEMGQIGDPDLDANMVPRALDVASFAGGGMLPMKAGEASLGAGLVRPAASEAAPVFYSAVENAVKDAKLNVGTADQWLGYLKNQPGVKQEELDWTLGDLPTDSKLTKADVQAHVDANKVQINDVDKGNAPATYNDQGEPSGTFPQGSTTKFQQYQLPGGTNYQEKLLTLPQKMVPNGKFVVTDGSPSFNMAVNTRDEAQQIVNNLQQHSNKPLQIVEDKMPSTENFYHKSHFDEPNIVAHVRMNDRNVDGLKTLHLEEIQSDWHQAGRREGYKITPEQKTQLEAIDNKLTSGLSEKDIGNPDMKAVLDTAVEKKVITPAEAKNYADWSKGENSTVPNAPFKSSWSDLALKRMIRHASENGYDAISWTPGEAQAARYDLSKQISKIEFTKHGSSGFTRPEEIEGNTGGIIKAFDHSNNKVIDKYVEAKELPDIIGKDIAEKLLKQEYKSSTIGGTAQTSRKLEGLDLKVGGEGMKTFYDKMLVNKANELAKKYGGRVEDKDLDYNKYENFKIKRVGEKFKVVNSNNQVEKIFGDQRSAQSYIDKQGTVPIHFLKLPQGLKDTATQKGFPLFSGGFPITPIQGNPLDQSGLNETVKVDDKEIPINNKQDVPDLAGASNNSPTVNIDKSVPRYDDKFKLKNGELGDIHKYLAIHETKEVAKMREDIAAFAEQYGRQPNAEEMHKIYLNAHYGTATPAEHAAIIADGGNPKDYEDVLHGYERKTENEKHADVPQDLYAKVYSHTQLRNMKMTPVKGNPFQ